MFSASSKIESKSYPARGITTDTYYKDKVDLSHFIMSVITNKLICISNMENINAVMINAGISRPQRLKRGIIECYGVDYDV